jgi:hypothetical protein
MTASVPQGQIPLDWVLTTTQVLTQMFLAILAIFEFNTTGLVGRKTCPMEQFIYTSTTAHDGE